MLQLSNANKKAPTLDAINTTNKADLAGDND